MSLTVLYSYGAGDQVATVLSSDKDDVLRIVPLRSRRAMPTVTANAFCGPIPTESDRLADHDMPRSVHIIFATDRAWWCG